METDTDMSDKQKKNNELPKENGSGDTKTGKSVLIRTLGILTLFLIVQVMTPGSILTPSWLSYDFT